MSSQADVLVWEDVGFKPSSLRGLSRFDTVAHIFVKCWVVWHFDLIQVLFFSNLKTEQFFETLKWKSVRIIETLRQFYGDSTDQSCCFHLDEVINGESGKAPKQHQGRKAFHGTLSNGSAFSILTEDLGLRKRSSPRVPKALLENRLARRSDLSIELYLIFFFFPKTERNVWKELDFGPAKKQDVTWNQRHSWRNSLVETQSLSLKWRIFRELTLLFFTSTVY